MCDSKEDTNECNISFVKTNIQHVFYQLTANISSHISLRDQLLAEKLSFSEYEIPLFQSPLLLVSVVLKATRIFANAYP